MRARHSVLRWFALARCAVALLLAAVAGSSVARLPAATADAAPIWQPRDIVLEATREHPWWAFPVRASFTHEATGEEIRVEGFWDGARRWVIRFAPSRAGAWTYRTVSEDAGLNDRQGRVVAAAASATAIAENANLRGPVRIAPGRRHFTYADGAPFFLLADTAWALNTARCGLGANEDGPFFAYVADRRRKGFTAVLMQYFHGYGDYPDSPGHRNEGGYAILDRDPARLNPEHFRRLDTRLRVLWEHGFVAAINATWWGKTRRCVFTAEDARRIVAYCAVRYGAFNALWSPSGEYQYVFKDCGWTSADITRLGEILQAHNPARHPVSIHPSARLDWPAPHNVQSSLPFHGESWLDHHWLQTGQSFDRLHNIVTRLAENRALAPAVPVFLSEAWYESAADRERAYHARWQVWTAFLNGAAGFGYGADGIWQFFDPGDAKGETGKDVKGVVPWREALRGPGSEQLVHARRFLEALEWWRLDPQRQRLRVDGGANPLPTPKDISPPQFAAIPGGALVAYIPRGNATRALTLTSPHAGRREARWYDPRRGEFTGDALAVGEADAWTIPPRPAPEEDWVLLISPAPTVPTIP